MSTVHDFNNDLGSDLKVMQSNKFQNQMLKHLGRIVPVTDLTMQKQGIDFWCEIPIYTINELKMKDSNTGYYAVDLKFRKQWYEDIALEIYSNYEYQRVGWAVDGTKRTEIIVYYFEDKDCGYIINYRRLRSWLQSGSMFPTHEEIDRRKKITPKDFILSRNVSYSSLNYLSSTTELRHSLVPCISFKSQPIFPAV